MENTSLFRMLGRTWVSGERAEMKTKEHLKTIEEWLGRDVGGPTNPCQPSCAFMMSYDVLEAIRTLVDNARESQSVAQADGSDVDAARNWVARNEGVFHGHAEEPGVRPYLAGIQHGRASEHFEARKPYDVAMQKLEHERARSAGLLKALKHIRNNSNLWRIGRAGGCDKYAGLPPAMRTIDDAIAEYEREK